MRDGAKHSEAEVDRGNMTSKRLVSWRSLNPRSLPPLGFSHFTRSPHGVSEVRHEPREGREVGERYAEGREAVYVCHAAPHLALFPAVSHLFTFLSLHVSSHSIPFRTRRVANEVKRRR